jgi:hypothetical protein
MNGFLGRAATSVALLPLLVLAACAHDSLLRYPDDPSVHPDLEVSVAWLERRRDRVEMRLLFRNRSSYPLTFTGNAVAFAFDGRHGAHSEDFVRTLLPGETDARTIAFRFEQLVGDRGVGTLVIDPIHKGGVGPEKERQSTRRYFRRFDIR